MTQTQAPKLETPMQAVARKETPKDFPGMLKAFLPEIQRALPKHLSGDRMARIAMTEFRKNPKLQKCEPKTIFASIIIGSQLGLEPGIMGQAFLVPYNGVCQLIPGWQGLVDLVSRAGRASVWTGAVFEGDEFDYGLGDRPFVSHKPAGNDDDPTKLTHVYAVGRIKGSDWPIVEVWSVSKVTRHRDRYNKVGNGHYSYDNFEMYGRKVALLQVLKYVPKSIELATAIALDNAAEVGNQNVGLKDAIEGTWAPVPPEQDATTTQAEETGDLKPAAKAEGATAKPKAETSSPSLDDALAAVKSGDIDVAKSILGSLNEHEQVIVNKAIENKEKPSGKPSASKRPVFKE